RREERDRAPAVAFEAAVHERYEKNEVLEDLEQARTGGSVAPDRDRVRADIAIGREMALLRADFRSVLRARALERLDHNSDDLTAEAAKYRDPSDANRSWAELRSTIKADRELAARQAAIEDTLAGHRHPGRDALEAQTADTAADRGAIEGAGELFRALED